MGSGVEQLDAKDFTQQFAANMLDVGLDAMACLQSGFHSIKVEGTWISGPLPVLLRIGDGSLFLP